MTVSKTVDLPLVDAPSSGETCMPTFKDLVKLPMKKIQTPNS
jgi:hypothetical protein